MPEQEIKERIKYKKMILAVLALLVLLILMLVSQYFYATKSKNKKEPEFNYTPTIVATTSETALEISALSYLGAYVAEDGQTIILAEKNSEDLLPMASITKLMTAIVAYKNYNMDDKITIGTKVNDWADSSKRFTPGTIFNLRELMRSLLIESNNDSAMALAGKVGADNFMAMMNNEAKNMGMITTHYDNPVGLDPSSKKEIINYSTAKELLVLMKEIIKNYPQILETTSIPQQDIKTTSGGYNHTAISTDKFLSSEGERLLCQGEPLKIVGGKTGSTDLAKKNLILAMESPNKHGYLITIVLSANDNFLETKNLVNWLCESYNWPMPAENILQNGAF